MGSVSEAPMIIIDRGSDPDVKTNSTDVIIEPKIENKETSLVKYLSPPPMRSRRQPSDSGSSAPSSPSTSTELFLMSKNLVKSEKI